MLGPNTDFIAGANNLARYQDNFNWGTVLARYDAAWFPGAPGYSQRFTNLLYMQAGLGGGVADGIAPILTWKAPDTGTYVVTGRFVSGDQVGNGASVAIVDSRGTAKLSRTSLPTNTVQDFSFTNTYGGGEVLQFQVGTDYKIGNAVGLEVGMQKIVSSSTSTITNWNAARDFYLSPTAGGWGGATYPSEAGSAWSYYAANVNGYGFANQIGTYFTPQSSGIGSQNLYPYFGFNTQWDATGGFGFGRYLDNLGWGSSLGVFDSPWDAGIPGQTTDARGGIWMQAGYLRNSDPANGGPAEGIAPVLTWTAPRSGIYDFQGSFLVAVNGVGTALVNSGASIAIVASTESAPILSNTNANQGMDYPFVFRKKLNQGDVIQFQVGTAYKIGAAVGLSADVTRVGDINQIVPSAVILNGPSTLAYANPGTELKPKLVVLGSGSSNSPTPSYFYEGVDVNGNIYSSSSAPTVPGRYEVTATIPANTNNHPWSASTNKIRFSVGTFNAFKDFRWNRTNGQAAWKGATTMNAWSYGSMDCEGQPITGGAVDQKFRALSGASHNPGNSSYSYVHATNPSNRISWIAANSNSAVLSLSPGGGDGGGLASALRWTAPAAGTYRFQGKFEPQNSSPMSVAIQTIDDADPSDNTQFPTSGTGTVSFDVTTNVLSGQKVTWVVGGPAGGVMNLSVDVSQLTAAAVPPTITSTNAFSGTVGVAFSNNITASGDAPVVFSGTDLPSGLAVATNGVISGTNMAAGTFTNVILTAANVAGTNSQVTTFTIAKGTQFPVYGFLGSSSVSAGSTTTVTAAFGSGTGAYVFRQNGGPGVTFSGTGDSRTINTFNAGTADIEVKRLGDDNYNETEWVSAGTLTVNPAGDTEAPVITLAGSATVTVAWGGAYIDEGATAIDNVDSSVTVISSGTVNTSVPGTYTITFTASDAAGNAAETKTRTVTVDKPSSTPGADGLSPLLRLAYGGTNSNSVVARPSLALSGSNLTLTAIVRTNQSNLTVVGQWVTNVNQFTNTNVVNSNTITGTASANQTNVPAGCERRVFSVPQNTDTRKFLRLKVEMP